jgi:hypothetical protein
LLAILNAGDRRHSAYVSRSVPTPDGGWESAEFCVWGPVALAGINELPQTLQDRSISLLLRRVLATNVPEQLRDGSSPKLVDLRRQFAAWGSALDELPETDLPALLRRQPARLADNWRPLWQIAALAAGQWPALLEEAIVESIRTEVAPTRTMRLLRSIWRAFDRQAEVDANTVQAVWDRHSDNPLQLTTPMLIRYLLEDPEEEWATANRGKPVTSYYLRHELRDLLNPKGTQEWMTGPTGQQRHHRGYLRTQFSVAWETILPADEVGAPDAEETPTSSHTPNTHSQGSGVSGVSGFDTPSDKPDAPDKPDTPDCAEKVGAEEGAAATTAPPTNGAEATQPKEAGPKSGRRPNRITILLRDLATANPKWSDARLARASGQPLAVVKKALAGWERPNGATP